MFSLFRPRLRNGILTESLTTLEEETPESVLGRPRLVANLCTADGACVGVCPSAALALEQAAPTQMMWRIDYGACVFCGRCAEACPTQAITITTQTALSTRTRADLIARVPVSPERSVRP